MKVAIRLDVSTTIGTGHLNRMLSVAGPLSKAGTQVVFILRHLDVDPREIVEAHGFETAVLPSPSPGFEPDPAIAHSDWAGVSQQTDAAETVAALANDPPDVVIVDHYAFDAQWHRAVRSGLRCALMVADDLGDRAIEAEWLIDHNFHPDHAQKYAGRLCRDARMLVGPHYAMLSDAYANAPRYRFSPRVGSIGVFMGGVDVRGDSFRVLQALNDAGWAGPVEVVSTSLNPALPNLATHIAAHPGWTLTRDLPDLAGFFARHDLQIGAGGGAIWERCCIGPPSICLVCSSNQRLSVPFLDAAGVVVGYDLIAEDRDQSSQLAKIVRDAIDDDMRRAALHQSAMALVDGQGAARVAAALTQR